MLVLKKAYRITDNCNCGVDAACYRCLKVFSNQYVHDLLDRGMAAVYLEKLIQSIEADPLTDHLYPSADISRMLKKVLTEADRVDVVAVELTSTNPPEIGNWQLFLQQLADKVGNSLRVVLDKLPSSNADVT